MASVVVAVLSVTATGGAVWSDLSIASAAAAPSPIVTSIGVGGRPEQLAVSPDGSTLYVSDSDSASVDVVNLSTDAVTDTIPLGKNVTPYDIAVSPDGSRVYVESNPGSLTVINTANDSIVASLPIGTFDGVLALSPDGSKVYVAAFANSPDPRGIDVVDTATNTISANIPVGGEILTMAVTPDGSKLFASVVGSDTSSLGSSLDVIDTATDSISTSITMTNVVWSLAVSPSGSQLYLTTGQASHAQQLDAVDTTSDAVNWTVTVSEFAVQNGIAVSPDGSTVYVDDSQRGKLTVVDASTHTIEASVPTAGSSLGLALSPDGSTRYVASQGSSVELLGTQIPYGLASQSHSSSTVGFGWSAPIGAASVSGYVARYSSDGGATWHNVPGDPVATTQASAVAPPSGDAYEYDVKAITSTGTSAASAPLIVSGGGTTAQSFTIQTPSGAPISGGAVSWEASDGNSSSSVAYALTDNGTVSFPEAVAGSAKLHLSDGLLPNGSTVSGSWTVPLGTPMQTLTTPIAPALSTPTVTVTVTMPNGVPVVDAVVKVLSGLAPTATSGGFSFAAPASGSGDVSTDGSGNAELTGYVDPGTVPTVRVTYDDGVLSQGQTVSLTGSQTNVTLQYMPWLTVNDGSGTTPVGETQAVAFEVKQSSSTRAAAAVGARSKPRVKISIKPPAGWSKKRCRKPSKLSGRTSKAGRLTLQVCASVSGDYIVKSHGAVPTRQLMLRVKGAPSTPPLSATARSPKPGKARLSWAKPVYSGGSRVSEYRVTAALKGHKTKVEFVRHKHFTAKSLDHTFSGLKRAKTWTFKVYAITKHGSSRAATCTLRVA
jgi:YVTN family beta-propeller protein